MKNVLIVNLLFTTFLILTFFQCVSAQESSVERADWGESGGKKVELFTLRNQQGMEIKVTNYGGTLVSVLAPDSGGNYENVVIGFDSLQEYQEDFLSRGRTIGRYANRIGGAEFTLDGETYQLTANNGPNTLHGGANGFSSQVFVVDSVYSNADSAVVALRYESADMEEGFPGNLILQLRYILTGENEVKIDYTATTDKPTVVNFTNHSYFNLTGNGESILDHRLKIEGDSITVLGPDMLPTGNIVPVEGTTYDFSDSPSLGENIETDSRGYDINYKLRKCGSEYALAARVTDPGSGRVLETYTTEPGLQLFTMGNSICLEAQHFPDSPHHPHFPSTVLRPGETYRQLTTYKFSVAAE